MTDTKRVHYAREPSVKHQPRGAISVKTSGVTVVCTHLDDISDASIVRQEQVRTILREWSDVTPMVVMGDLNAPPDAIEIRLFNEAGFDDLGAAAGATTTMDDPQKRIDYILGKGVIGAQAHIGANNDLKRLMDASDHRTVVVNITIPR
jgi:endonuclease/exonuclease/phosphatase family metal-dependent hydrolase